MIQPVITLIDRNGSIHSYPIDCYIVWQSFSIAYRELRAVVARTLEQYNISPSEWGLLGVLYEYPLLEQKEIAAFLSVEPPLVTQMITILRKKQMIEITNSPDDKRKKIVSLTLTTRSQIPLIETSVNQAIQNILKGCTPEEVSVYFKVLERIIENASNN